MNTFTLILSNPAVIRSFNDRITVEITGVQWITLDPSTLPRVPEPFPIDYTPLPVYAISTPTLEEESQPLPAELVRHPSMLVAPPPARVVYNATAPAA